MPKPHPLPTAPEAAALALWLAWGPASFALLAWHYLFNPFFC